MEVQSPHLGILIKGNGQIDWIKGGGDKTEESGVRLLL